MSKESLSSQSYNHGSEGNITDQLKQSNQRLNEGKAGEITERSKESYGITPESSLGKFLTDLDKSEDWSQQDKDRVGGEEKADSIRQGVTKAVDTLVPGAIGYGIRAATGAMGFGGPLVGLGVGAIKGGVEAGLKVHRIVQNEGGGAATLYEKKVSGRDRAIQEAEEQSKDNKFVKFLKKSKLQLKKYFNYGQYQGLEKTLQVKERDADIKELSKEIGIEFQDNGEIKESETIATKLQETFKKDPTEDNKVSHLCVKLHEQMILSAFSEQLNPQARKQMVDLLTITSGVIATEHKNGEPNILEDLYKQAKSNTLKTVSENKQYYIASTALEKGLKGALFAWIGGLLRDTWENYQEAQDAAEEAQEQLISKADTLGDELDQLQDNRDLIIEQQGDLEEAREQSLEKMNNLINDTTEHTENITDGLETRHDFSKVAADMVTTQMGEGYIEEAAERVGRIEGIGDLIEQVQEHPNGALVKNYAILVGADPEEGIGRFTPEQLERAAKITEGIAGKTLEHFHPDLENSRTVLDDFIGNAAKEMSAITTGAGTNEKLRDGLDILNTSMENTGGDSFVEATKKLFFGVAAQNSEFTPYEIEQSLEISDQADIWGNAMTKYQENKSILQKLNYGIVQKAKDTTAALEEISNFADSETAKASLHQLTKSLLGTAVAVGKIAIPGYVLAGDAKVSFGGGGTGSSGNNGGTSVSDDGMGDSGNDSTDDDKSQSNNTNDDKTNKNDPDFKKKLSEFQSKKGKLPVKELFSKDVLSVAAEDFNHKDSPDPRNAKFYFNEKRNASEIQFRNRSNLLRFLTENKLTGGVLPQELTKAIADSGDDKWQYVLQHSEEKGISFYYKNKKKGNS